MNLKKVKDSLQIRSFMIIFSGSVLYNIAKYGTSVIFPILFIAR